MLGTPEKIDSPGLTPNTIRGCRCSAAVICVNVRIANKNVAWLRLDVAQRRLVCMW
jgi:hypothetical protein